MATLHPPMVYPHVLRYTLFFVLQLTVMGTEGVRALSCSGSEDEGIHVQPDPPRASGPQALGASSPHGLEAYSASAASSQAHEPQGPHLSLSHPRSMDNRGLANRRGRRSALLLEVLEEHRAAQPSSQCKNIQHEHLQAARLAKAEKQKAHRAATSSMQAQRADDMAVVPLPMASNLTPCLDKGLLEKVAAGPQTAFGTSPLSAVFAFVQPPDRPDPGISSLVAEFSRQAERTMGSMKVEADRCGLLPKRLRELLPRFASAAVISDQTSLRTLEEAAAARPLELLLYADAAMYDETPMVARADRLAFEITEAESMTAPLPQGGSAMQRGVKITKTTLASDSGPTKIFQTTTTVVMLLKQDNVEAGQAANYYIVVARPLSSLQFVDASSGEVLHAALRASSSVSAAANQFLLKARVATSDRLAANMKAERQLVADRGSSWLSLQSPCDVHCVSGAQGKTFALIPEVLASMVNFSLSLRVSGNMARFRSCLRAVVATRLKIMQGEPGTAANEYRTYCLRSFLSRGANAARRRMMLWIWLNGDWKDENNIQHYLDPRRPQAQNQPDVVCRMVTRAIIGALAAKAPSTYPRHLWTDCDIATDEVGLPLCVHNILHHAYVAFCASYGHKAALLLAKPSSPTVPGQAAQQPILQTIEDQAEERPELDEGPQEGDTANQQPDESSAPAGFTLGEDSIDWQELST